MSNRYTYRDYDRTGRDFDPDYPEFERNSRRLERDRRDFERTFHDYDREDYSDADRYRMNRSGQYSKGDFRTGGNRLYGPSPERYSGREYAPREYNQYERYDRQVRQEQDYGPDRGYGALGVRSDLFNPRNHPNYEALERHYEDRPPAIRRRIDSNYDVRNRAEYDIRDQDERGLWDRATDEVSSWFGDEEATQRRRMDQYRGGYHRGKGPKGYRRSDERIREDVNDRLTEDGYLDASEVEVAVNNGEVTLTGIVVSRHDKRRAEDIAESASGVNNVENRLRVKTFNRDYDTSTVTTSTTTTDSVAPRAQSATSK